MKQSLNYVGSKENEKEKKSCWNIKYPCGKKVSIDPHFIPYIKITLK